MKRLILLLLFTSINLYSMDWEFQFKIYRIVDGVVVYESGVPISISVFNPGTGAIVPNTTSSGYTFGYAAYGTFNAACDMVGVNEETLPLPNIQPILPAAEYYIVQIGTLFYRIKHLRYADETFELNLDGGTLSLGRGNYQVQSTGIGTNCNITLKNDYDGGAMYFNGIYESSIELSGRTVSRADYTFPHSLTAVTGLTGTDGFKRLWKIWSDTWEPLGKVLSTAGNYTTLEARFNKEINLTFQTNGKPFTADGENYSSDQTLYKREQITFSAYASNTTYNDVDYTFLYWKKDGSAVSNSITVPSAHATYVAWYSAKPNVNNRSLSSNSQVGQNVTITWNVHPNTNVTGYKVYRKVKVNGVVGQETLLASLSSRYSTSYTDYDYTITNDPNDSRLMYDVRPVYTDTQNNQVESDPYYITIAFGIIEFSIVDNSGLLILDNSEISKDFSINNYPNPFNPTTTINYQLPENGFVTIKVYDLLGKEVAALVNENKSAGYYKVTFNASKLTSGIYIYTITANNFVQSKKMLLMK